MNPTVCTAASGQGPKADRGRAPIHRAAQRGAAILLAMVLLALVSSMAAGMVWQQWRSVQVEAAERSRSQSAWILAGALDWTRLILREDARSGAVDHEGEPWATPLAEARLSSFLAADRDNTADSDVEAFLAGAITDAQSRYNLRNLFADDGKPLKVERETLERLCAAAGLGTPEAERLASGLAASWRKGGAVPAQGGASSPSGGTVAPTAGADEGVRVLPVQRFEHLAWLGLEPQVLQALRPLVDVLPTRTPVNVNTASREVLAAVLGVDAGSAERLMQARQRRAFDQLDQVRLLLPAGALLEASRLSVGSEYFEVRGRLRLEDRVLEESSLVRRRGPVEVTVMRRSRRHLHSLAG